jgi:acylphosphatase
VSTNRPGDRPDASHDSTAPYEDPVRLTAWLTGAVQGVGMRWWIRARALELGLAGWAANRPDGRVEVVAEGDRAAAESLLAQLAEPRGTRPGRVTGVVDQWGAARGGLAGFEER